METKDISTNNKELDEKLKAFKEFAKVAEEFINKWGCPYTTVILTQGHIELLEGEMAIPLKILD